MARVKQVKKEEVIVTRFVDNKDNTVTDQKTGLLIIQDPTLLGEPFTKTLTFAEAEQAISDLNTKGYSGFKDWRLPTVEELCGMIDRTKHDPCYDTKIFKGKFDDWYWSKETCSWNSAAVWCVLSYGGDVNGSSRYNLNYVRPVRSSQSQFYPLPVR